jgi:hypothetical protein
LISKEFRSYSNVGQRIQYEISLIKSLFMQKENQVKKIQKVFREKKEMDWDKI